MNKEKVMGTIKLVGGLVISIGIGAITKNLIKATTPEDVKRFTKFCIGVGSFFVAGAAAKAATDKFDGTFDSFTKFIETLMQEKGNNEAPVEVVTETEV